MGDSIVERMAKLNVWKRGDEPAPHKPLPLLYMKGRYLHDAPQLLQYREMEEPLKQLLVDFGPSRQSYHSELPFWHLHSDGFWDLENVSIPAGGMGGASRIQYTMTF